MSLGAYDREQRYLVQRYGGTVAEVKAVTRTGERVVTGKVYTPDRDGALTSRQQKRRDGKVNHAIDQARYRYRRGRSALPGHGDVRDTTRLIRSGNPARREAGWRMRYLEHRDGFRWNDPRRGVQ
jgi:hypothetical protein